MVDPRPRPIERISGNPKFLGNLVGGREADAVDVFRKHVRIAPYLFNCLFTVCFENSSRSTGAYAVAVKEQHNLTDLLRLLPRPFDPFPALGADPVNLL